MKKSNKLTAAGVGLLIAAAAGLGPALASDGSNAEISEGSQSTSIEVGGIAGGNTVREGAATEEAEGETADESSRTVADNTQDGKDKVDVTNGEPADSADSDSAAVTDKAQEADAEGNENAKPDVTENSQTGNSIEVVRGTKDTDTESAGPGGEDSSTTEQVTGEKTTGNAEKTAGETDSVESPEVTKPDQTANSEEVSSEQTSQADPVEENTANKTPATDTSSASATEGKSEKVAKRSTAAKAPVKPARRAPVVHVSYMVAPTVALVDTAEVTAAEDAAETSSSTASTPDNAVASVNHDQAEAPKPVKPVVAKQLGPVLPLLSAATEHPDTPGSVNLQQEAAGAATDNGQSMVVWFELPRAEGPKLQPGEATKPLLGSAVSESAVSSNVIAASAVAPQEPPVGSVATAAAPLPKSAAPAKAERGVMARTLARTGSVAQYAAVLSAVAMIVGVGMLIGAAAARRTQRPTKNH